MNHILKVIKSKEEVPVRWPYAENMVQEQVDKNIADFVTVAIWRQVEMEDLRRWGLAPDAELRPDTTGKMNRRLGEALGELISQVTP